MERYFEIKRELDDENPECDFLLGGQLGDLDPEIQRMINFEEARQTNKIIMIASESLCPFAVRQAIGSVFTNIYAEGYPSTRMSRWEKEIIMNHDRHLAFFRRYADRRYYKGTEFVNFVEVLAQKRCAELFATDDDPNAKIKVRADEIFVNVQPLSGAAANNAVYEAFCEVGDTVMGMSLTHGGHLTHGSEFNVSGKRFNIVSYEIGRDGKLDFKKIKKLALETKPKMIIAGYSAYPWSVDWEKFREVADAVPGGAILFADIAHPAGLVSAGQFPTPIGYADVITFTTHKTMCGPRGAVIMTTNPENAQKVDMAVFPGEQGGPHINSIAGKAVIFKIAQTETFKELQRQIIKNAKALGEAFEKLGLKLAYGGTDSHMVLIDTKGLKTKSGLPLNTDIASRILDICGITCNKNTIAGDESAANPTGLRFGTTFVTQMGMNEKHIEKLAEIINKILANVESFDVLGAFGRLGRAKIDMNKMLEVKNEIDELLNSLPDYKIDEEELINESPLSAEYKKLNPKIEKKGNWSLPVSFGNEEKAETKNISTVIDQSDMGIFEIRGERVRHFLQGISTTNIFDMPHLTCKHSALLGREGEIIDDVLICRLEKDMNMFERFLLKTNRENTDKVESWLNGHSDGYIFFEEEDIYAKIDGPVEIKNIAEEGKTSIAIQGKNAFDLLKNLNPDLNNIEKFQLTEIKFFNSNAILARTGFKEEDIKFEIIAHEDEVKKIWNSLIEDKKSAVPVGTNVRDKHRKDANLPVYEELDEPVKGISLINNGNDYFFNTAKPYYIGQVVVNEELKLTSNKKEYEFKDYEGPLRRTCLYEEHLKLTKKRNIVPFAGWEMPVLYTSIQDEHNGVRTTAGLFDVSHMGVLEIKGEYASRFLDLVTTNFILKSKTGQAHYNYLVDPNGCVIDDIFVYRIEENRYMVVVNAVNAEKDEAWLRAVNSKEYIIDNRYPNKEVEGEVTIRNLKDDASGKDMRIDLGLQGKASLNTLLKLKQSSFSKVMLKNLQRSEFFETDLEGINVIIARTGYTGEEIGYEIYPHPENAPRLWNLILENGEEFGVQPTGLGARDSTRTEAGFPLYGHELAGEYDITPREAGYGSFVKKHKPFFIGRERLLQKEDESNREIVRFRLNRKKIRMVKPHNPVVNRKGDCVGNVTSCTMAGDYQVGLALVDKRYTEEGTQLGIFILPKKSRMPEVKPWDQLKRGDSLILHETATVIPRFPKVGEEVESG